MKARTLGDYQRAIAGARCRFCGQDKPDGTRIGTLLDRQGIKYYDHDGGYEVAGFVKRQWLYVTCPVCQHDWSLVHLQVPRTTPDDAGSM